MIFGVSLTVSLLALGAIHSPVEKQRSQTKGANMLRLALHSLPIYLGDKNCTLVYLGQYFKNLSTKFCILPLVCLFKI